MGKQIEKLTALEAKAFNTPGKRLSDGGNLYLACAQTGRSKTWEFTYKRHGRQRTKGIGSVEIVSMKDARAKAAEYRRMLAQGIDPIEVAHWPRSAHTACRPLLQCSRRSLTRSKPNGARRW